MSTMQVSAWQFPIIRGCTNHYQSDAGSRMKYLLISIVVVLWLQAVHSSSFSGNEEKTPLYFSYITTITGDLTIAGAIPVVDLALEQINNRTDILPNYTFNYTTIRDSKVYPMPQYLKIYNLNLYVNITYIMQCSRTASLNAFMEDFRNDSQPTYVSLLCCGCSTATIPVAEISHYWNIPQVYESRIVATTRQYNNYSKSVYL